MDPVFTPIFAYSAAQLLAPIVLSIVAIAVMLVAWAGRELFGEVFRRVLGLIPFIGGAIGDAVANGISAATSWATSWLNGYVYPIVQVVLSPLQRGIEFASTVTAAVEWLLDAGARLQSELRKDAAAFSAAIGDIGNQLGGLGPQILSLVVQAAAASSAILLIRNTLLPQAKKQAVDEAALHADAAVDVEAGHRAAETAATRARADQQLSAEAQARMAADAQSQAAAAAALAAVVATITGAAHTETAERQAADAGLARSVAAVDEKVQPIVDANVVGNLAALTAVVESTFARCVIPQCNVWGPQMDWLDALRDGALLVGLLAVVGEAIEHPDAAARGTADAVAGLHGAASSVLGAVGVSV